MINDDCNHDNNLQITLEQNRPFYSHLNFRFLAVYITPYIKISQMFSGEWTTQFALQVAEQQWIINNNKANTAKAPSLTTSLDIIKNQNKSLNCKLTK